jgi:hypothetical protein
VFSKLRRAATKQSSWIATARNVSRDDKPGLKTRNNKEARENNNLEHDGWERVASAEGLYRRRNTGEYYSR